MAAALVAVPCHHAGVYQGSVVSGTPWEAVGGQCSSGAGLFFLPSHVPCFLLSFLTPFVHFFPCMIESSDTGRCTARRAPFPA